MIRFHVTKYDAERGEASVDVRTGPDGTGPVIGKLPVVTAKELQELRDFERRDNVEAIIERGRVAWDAVDHPDIRARRQLRISLAAANYVAGRQGGVPSETMMKLYDELAKAVGAPES